MKVNEFRIGNLVMCNGDLPFLFKGVTYRITDIKEDVGCVAEQLGDGLKKLGETRLKNAINYLSPP